MVVLDELNKGVLKYFCEITDVFDERKISFIGSWVRLVILKNSVEITINS